MAAIVLVTGGADGLLHQAPRGACRNVFAVGLPWKSASSLMHCKANLFSPSRADDGKVEPFQFILLPEMHILL
jgi:hypothetical protein